MYSFCAGMKSYSGAANDGVECRAFRRFGRRGMPRNATQSGVRTCPETPHSFCSVHPFPTSNQYY